MKSFLMIVFSLTISSSASAQIYYGSEIAPTYVEQAAVIQNTLPSVEYAGGTFTSSVNPIATTNYSQPIVSSTPMTSTYPATTYPSANYYPTTTYPSSTSSGQVTPGWAQQKAQQAATSSVRGHLNNQLGGARYEGVGWSSVSPQSAIQNCCYWGTRPVCQIGVSQSQDGCWYACVLYQ